LRSLTTIGPGVNRTDTYGYDAMGNTTSRPGTSAGQTLVWNSEHRLANVTENGQQTSFLYDASGARLIRRDPTGTTLYLPGMELFKPAGTGSAVGTRFYAHAGQGVAVRTSAGLQWQVSDHHGTSHLSFNASTLAKTQHRTLPFGGVRGANPAWPSQKGFVGGTIDASTALVHLGAREYDTATGRFTSADPLLEPGDPQQVNGYSYAKNSPLTLSDPDGLRPQCPDDDCHGWFNGPDKAGDPARKPQGGGGSTGGGGSSGGTPTAPPPAPAMVSRPQPPGQAGPPSAAPAAKCGHNNQIPPCYKLDNGWVGDQMGMACPDIGDFAGPVIYGGGCVPGGAWGGAFKPPPSPPTKPDHCGSPPTVIGPPRGPVFTPQRDKHGYLVPPPGGPSTSGTCVQVGLQVIGAVGLEYCLVRDAEGWAVTGGYKLGVGLGFGGGLSGGPMRTNAKSAEELVGEDYYGGVSAGPVSWNHSSNLEGIHTDSFGIGPRVKFGAEAGASSSSVLFRWR
jgi:RHS repeat-associated protein